MTGNVLELQDSSFAIEQFLAAEAAKDLLRFSTAGSVDDGKSTLIGRLLYDSRNVYEDQVRAVTGRQVGQQSGTIDFALLTDGLRAEREQGITIDVAYRYFSTQRRKFIIADTPGHEQYTRNMATGASTADLAIILVDARKGILTQSRRHAYIASLLGTRHLVAAINKMDLVHWSQDTYLRLSAEMQALVGQVGGCELVAVPVSALEGDNVVNRSTHMPWYQGPTLLEHLEAVPVWTDIATRPFRMPVQRVIRPDQNYRGFAGQIASGTIRVGDAVTALPSARGSRVASITTYNGDIDEASAPLSIALTLEDELDMSRGDMLSKTDRLPQRATALEASLVWFDVERLDSGRPYLLKHGASVRTARVRRVANRTDFETLAEEPALALGMNDIGVVELQFTLPLFFDTYRENRASGSFILVDPHSNATVAAGMIRRALSDDGRGVRRGALLFDADRTFLPEQVEAALRARGANVVRTGIQDVSLLQSLCDLGIIVLLDEVPRESISTLEPIMIGKYKDIQELIDLLTAEDILAG